MASAQLRDTRRRIGSVDAIKKITRAMELIAASRIPKAQARVHGSKPYTAKLIEVIENVGAAGGTSHRLLEQRDIRTVGLLIVSSARGPDPGAGPGRQERRPLCRWEEGPGLLPLPRLPDRGRIRRRDRHPRLWRRPRHRQHR